MAHQVAQVENRPSAVRFIALYHKPVVFIMLGLKLATDRVDMTSIIFHSPKNVGEAIASGPVPSSRMSYENRKVSIHVTLDSGWFFWHDGLQVCRLSIERCSHGPLE
jgi:hypothetical protein